MILTSATNISKEIIRLSVANYLRKTRILKKGARAEAPLPIIISCFFESVAQSVEQPVVCGKVEGATPFGSAILSECSSVFRAPGLGLGGRR